MRKEFSAKVKVAAFERAEGRCETCTAKLAPGNVEYDHVNPDWMGGEPTLENCSVLCRACHAIKTPKDQRAIAKSKRVKGRHIGARRSRRPMPGGRASLFKKKINGEVVRRDGQ